MRAADQALATDVGLQLAADVTGLAQRDLHGPSRARSEVTHSNRQPLLLAELNDGSYQSIKWPAGKTDLLSNCKRSVRLRDRAVDFARLLGRL